MFILDYFLSLGQYIKLYCWNLEEKLGKLPDKMDMLYRKNKQKYKKVKKKEKKKHPS